jgi:TBC1 domain family member 20
MLEQTLRDGEFDDIEMSAMPSDNTKKIEVEKACDEVNLEELVRLADSSDGLLEDSLRCRAWPILLGYAVTKKSEQDVSWKSLPEHRDEAQVRLDVDRAFVYYPNQDSERTRRARKEQLFDLIVSVLRRHPALCYSQGYHDIAQVLLLVLGPAEAAAALTHLSLLRIRDYMLPSLAPALKHLQLLPAIFRQADPSLAAQLSHTDPYFAISATITLYAHNIEDYGDIARLFDFILAHEPVMSIYLFAAMIISRRGELLEIDEPDMLNFQLTKLPEPLDLQAYIDRALGLFEKHGPEGLPGFVWWRLPTSSVLKTSRSLKQPQTLEEAEETFQVQVKQLEQEKKRQDWQRKMSLLLKRNRRPVVSVTAALLAGCLAIWMRRTGNDQLVMGVLMTVVRSSWKK